MIADEETKKRMTSLGAVGTALMQISNDNSGLTDYLVAKEELKKFDQAVSLMELEPQIKAGMDNLIRYLSKKLEKRINQYNSLT